MTLPSIFPPLANFHPIQMLNGGVVYEIVSVPQVTTPAPKPSKAKRNRYTKQEGHVKKPPKAFMLFQRENRHRVVTDKSFRNSAKVNTILGQMVSHNLQLSKV
ncbi:lymphoid enhancer-binding factor 1-like [Dunckerocampus dactyliophorus]|uniref:lymphoid enhancer-binding factor 1-like n=1 Tax=Dunckerocampus dactyliophorus TaxID=161453 RepID=UPI002405CD7F|nr:lymphoid enhancer-binding factor 1-like [Dunckerocampus dactyliophorus]